MADEARVETQGRQEPVLSGPLPAGGPRVRSGGPADLPGVTELAGQVLPEAGDVSSLASFLSAAAGRLWVASSGARVVGFLLAQRVAEELEILWMAVAPAEQREGLGRALLEAASAEPPPSFLFLEVREGNRSARAFYSALGFRVVGVRKRYYRAGEDAIRMSRPA